MMADEKLLKVMMALEGDPGIFDCSAIEYEGAVWMDAMPERLIRLDQFAHRKLGAPGDPADYAINIPIPNALFEGPISRELAN
jgi:hypothetical protein